MNYYPFHLGDYAAHTAHLEPMEDLAYRRMLDAYYLREMPLPADPQEVARLIRMRQNVGDVEAVLREFFTLTDDGWRHTRCDEEIERMQDKQTKARASAAASVNARKAKAEQNRSERLTNVERTLNERSTDVELPTPTPTPTPREKKDTRSALAVRPDSVPADLWADFVAIRRAKRAPLTQTALDTIVGEAAKAGMELDAALRECCARGWQGFKAEWVAAKARPGKQAGLEARNADVAAKWVPPELRGVANAR